MTQSTCYTIRYSSRSPRYWYALVHAIGTAFDYRLQYRNAHALPVASSTDTMTIVLTSLRNSCGTAWHGGGAYRAYRHTLFFWLFIDSYQICSSTSSLLHLNLFVWTAKYILHAGSINMSSQVPARPAGASTRTKPRKLPEQTPHTTSDWRLVIQAVIEMKTSSKRTPTHVNPRALLVPSQQGKQRVNGVNNISARG